ncbi:DUF5994 family protein [Nocardia sp. NPDC051981]|uniref:DUF5994 family protein n=1 Tax=Nocardia sp. NPDC051981 TaxID=3155417 RepID=UPI00342C377C
MIRPNHHIPGSQRGDHNHPARARLKASETKTGYVDGAWWPYGTDLAIELQQLFTAVSARLGSVHRVVYSSGDWTPIPPQHTGHTRAVRLDGDRHITAHTIEVFGVENRRQILLIIPPHTNPHRADAVMAVAGRTDDESTVDQLLAQLHGRDGRAARMRQWRRTGDHPSIPRTLAAGTSRS